MVEPEPFPQKPSADKVRLAVLINSYNRVDLLRKAIESVETHLNPADLHYAVMIFDAGSQDGSREFATQAVSRCGAPHETALLDGRQLEDRSFSAGANHLAQEAIARYPNLQYLLLFETDNCLKGSDAIRRAISTLDAKTDIAAVGFTVVRHDGRATGFGCSFPEAAELVLGQQVTAALGLGHPADTSERNPDDDTTYPDVIYTSPLLVKVSAWKAVSGMNSKAFPFADSDLDLCWRWRKAGWRVGAIKTDQVVHDNHGTFSEWSERRTLAFHQSRLKLLEIHRGVNFRKLYPLLLLRHTAELACLTLSSPFISRARKRLKVRLSLISRLHRRYEA